MELKSRTIKELQRIMLKDYGYTLSESEAKDFGSSILRLTRLALDAIIKIEEQKKVKSSDTS